MNLKNTSIVLLSILSLSDMASAANSAAPIKYPVKYDCPPSNFKWIQVPGTTYLWVPDIPGPGKWSGYPPLFSKTPPVASYIDHSGHVFKEGGRLDVFLCSYNVDVTSGPTVLGLTVSVAGYYVCYLGKGANSVYCD